MKKKLLLSLILLFSFIGIYRAQTEPVITQWLQNNTIEGRFYTNGNSTPQSNNILANVQSVHYDSDYVYIKTTGVPSYITGPFLDGNIDSASDVEAIYQLPLTPSVSTTETVTSIGTNGVFINGVAIFDWQDTVVWDNDNQVLCGGPIGNCTTTGGGPGGGPGGPGGSGGGPGGGTTTTYDWNRDAIPAELGGFDCAKGHPANGTYHHHQNPTAFNLDLQVISDICDTYPADGLYVINNQVHSPIIGYAYDGYPIYGPYAYLNTNGTGAITRMKSSYSIDNTLATGDPRVNGPDIDEEYTYDNTHLGVEVTEVFINGYFKEDYSYTVNSASDYLDEHNGRFCITPEYPNGTYAYFATVDENHNSVFPYLIGPTYYGEVVGTNVASIPSSATQYTLNVTSFDEKRLDLSVYPNPAKDFIAIQSNNLQTSTLKIDLINELGQVVLSSQIYQGSTLSIIETHTLYNGIYFVKVSNGNEITKTYKVVINK